MDFSPRLIEANGAHKAQARRIVEKREKVSVIGIALAKRVFQQRSAWTAAGE